MNLLNRTYILISLSLFIACSTPSNNETQAKTAKATKPNILIILADDMGYADLGVMGSEISTPSIDKLAENGVLMTQFYNAGRCCPSRASLLTGMYAHKTGIGAMKQDLGHPAYKGYLNKQCLTLAEALKPAGYTSYISGKWHVGTAEPYWPLRRGFDRFYGYPNGGGIYYHPFQKPRNVVLDDKAIPFDTLNFYSTDEITRYALQFLDEHKTEKPDAPFFMYLAHVAPHFPLQALPEDIAKYRGKYKEGFTEIRKQRYAQLLELGLIDTTVLLSAPDELVRDWEGLSEEEQDDFDLRMATYAAQIDCMDRGIGEVIQKLDALGELDNTIIFFLSDNGGESSNLGRRDNSDTVEIGSQMSYTSYRPSWANVSNTPFKMYKHWVHEGGISTPLIVHYPKLIKEPRTDTQVGHIIDIMPTCLELAGAKYPQQFEGNTLAALDGQSLVPILKGNKWQEPPTLFWEHEGNKAVRKNDWKAVMKYPENQWHLYDMNVDRSEVQNLAETHPDTLSALVGKYQAWASEIGVMDFDWVEEQRRKK